MRSKRVTEKSRAKCGPYLTMLWRSKSVKIALLGILTLFVIICYLTSTSEEHRSRQFQSATDCDASYLKTVESRRDSDESVTLDTFDEDDFAVFNIGKDAVDLGDCVLATHLQPYFRICTFPPETDKFVSGGLRSGHGWEPWISKLLGKMLAACGGDAILLDVGANIGAHALYAAKLGYRVAGVEPQNINLARVYQSAKLENTSDRVTLYRHSLDSERREVKIWQNYGNIGGSHIVESAGAGKNLLLSRSVLLSDIFEDVVPRNAEGQQKLNIVMKVDIEHYECRAFLGSRNIFTDSRYFIPFVVMEWTYYRSNPDPEKVKNWPCPPAMLREMTDMFVCHGYVPFDAFGARLDPGDSLTWYTDVVWVHHSAVPVFPWPHYAMSWIAYLGSFTY